MQYIIYDGHFMFSQEATIYITILLAFCVFAGVVGFFVMTLFKYQKRINKLQDAQIRADVLMLEQERSRMASELHDEFGAYVSVIKYKLQSLELKENDDLLLISEAEAIIDEMMLKIRQLSYDLMPMLLETKGLRSSLDEFINLLKQGKKFTVHYVYELTHVEKEKTIHFFRIIQEALSNSVKHAKATEIKVMMYESKHAQYIEVYDNGKGFDKQAISRRQKGLGLLNIQARTQLLKGKMFLETAPEQGTHYTIEIPKDE
ncbi:sensor histidine kinase [Panacibacter ginsenosidivorans]|nr:ATP-binding protein [Panacibacter ginsenosidivorans]